MVNGYIGVGYVPQVSCRGGKAKSKPMRTDKSNPISIPTGVLVGLSAVGVATAAVIAVKSKTPDSLKYCYSEFIKNAREIGVKHSTDVIKDCKPENIIGTGANSVVYKFSNPKMKNWAIKIHSKKNDNIENSPIIKVADEFPDLNMGQEIARIGERVSILKRINASPHSIPDWSKHRRAQTPITQEDATKFLDDIDKIAAFPQKSFNKYAEKLKALDDKGYKADSFNPNNYLIDYKNKELHIIDAYKYDPDVHMNTKFDLFGPLVDYPNYEKYYNAMTPNQQKQYVAATAILNEKCTKAAEKVGLSTSESTFQEFISRVDGREKNGGLYSNSYSAMKSLNQANNLK